MEIFALVRSSNEKDFELLLMPASNFIWPWLASFSHVATWICSWWVVYKKKWLTIVCYTQAVRRKTDASQSNHWCWLVLPLFDSIESKWNETECCVCTSGQLAINWFQFSDKVLRILARNGRLAVRSRYSLRRSRGFIPSDGSCVCFVPLSWQYHY